MDSEIPEVVVRRHIVWVERAARMGCYARDLCLLWTGSIYVFVVTPPSISEAGFYGVTSIAWALLLFGGSLVSFIGLVLGKTLAELWGCLAVGGGFLLWTIAAVIQPDVTAVSLGVAGVLAAGVFGQIYRVGMIATGRVIRW